MAIIHIDKKTSDKSMSDYETMRESKVAYNYIKSGLIDSIRISTRPDCINKEILKRRKRNEKCT